MAKKIKLSELRLKSSVTELNSKERKAAKGGFYNPSSKTKVKGGLINWIANTEVDIRIIEVPHQVVRRK